MKIITQFILAVFLQTVTASAASVTPPQEIVIALSPFQPMSEQTNQEMLIQRFLLRDRPMSTRVTIWDGWNLRIISDLPATHLEYDSPAARAPRLAPAFAALHDWFNKIGSPPAGLQNSGAIKVLEWLDAVSERPATAGRVLVIALRHSFCHRTSLPFPCSRRGIRAMAIWLAPPQNPSMAPLTSTVVWITRASCGHFVPRISGLHSGTASASHDGGACLSPVREQTPCCPRHSDMPQILQEALHDNHRPVGQSAINPADSGLVMHVATEREVPVEVPAVKTRSLPKLNPTPARVTVPTTGAAPPQPPIEPKPETQPAAISPPAKITLDVGVTDSARYTHRRSGKVRLHNH